MMFVRENIKFLHKHYIDLVKEERDEHLHTSKSFFVSLFEWFNLRYICNEKYEIE